MNGASFKKCKWTRVGEVWGYRNYSEIYSCPTFSLLRSAPGIGKIEPGACRTDFWYVIDKDREKWPIYTCNYYGDHVKNETGVEPVLTRSERKQQNGCSKVMTLAVVGDGINLIIRRHSFNPLVKNMPTF